MPTSKESRILLVDAYDSFTHNLAALLARCTNAIVHIIHIDHPYKTISDLLPYLQCFDAVVIGPGPGSPEDPQDIGFVKDIWRLAEENLVPIFGVCLGLQSLCCEFGGEIRQMEVVKHGLTSVIQHEGLDLFQDAGEITAVRYHSLHAALPNGARTHLEPLAWAEDENGRVLMAVRHRYKPFWAVQYHPESICTEDRGDVVVRNFWKLATEWNKQKRRTASSLPESWHVLPRERSLLEQQRFPNNTPSVTGKVQAKSLYVRGLDAPRVCEMLQAESRGDFVLLDSAAVPGRWSIIGLVSENLTRLIKFTVGDSFATVSTAGSLSGALKVDLEESYAGSIWSYLASYMHERSATDGPQESPFWGGFVGYFSYEVGVNSLSIPLDKTRKRQPDVNLAFVERSIVLDTQSGKIYVQSLLADDDAWLESTKQLLQQEQDIALTPSTTPPPSVGHNIRSTSEKTKSKLPAMTRPDENRYKSLVSQAQSFLQSGHSYELCVTARTKVLLPGPIYPTPWSMYTRLRHCNPAPYAAYIRLQDVTLLSSSPERFLSYSRQGRIQLRPIKGTVKKSPSMTLARAHEILNTPKERAENLMIVDLIRHDLHRLLGKVDVEKLMVVEEYKTVYQLVSVISGTLPANQSDTGLTGFDVLARSLPPGSMTGAPKKRSVQILQQLEGDDRERGVYSGVAGYWSVCGAGDWSVVIRSAYRYDDEGEGEWWVGAGGAVTALSTPQGEWEEMCVKAESTVGAFA